MFSFFVNKVTIGVNRIVKHFPCRYVVAKDPAGFAEIFRSLQGATLIVSKHRLGNPRSSENSVSVDHYVFSHPEKPDEAPLLDCVGTDDIVVSWSTITSALHLAAYMGAKNIILCGHDCGTIDGEGSLKRYYEGDLKPEQKSMSSYVEWVSWKIEGHTLAVKARLEEVYGVNIHSLNPFINPNLEGHVYDKGPTAVEEN